MIFTPPMLKKRGNYYNKFAMFTLYKIGEGV